jgi:hypothetical protein
LAEKRKLGSEPEYKKERSRVRKFCNAIWWMKFEENSKYFNNCRHFNSFFLVEYLWAVLALLSKIS